MGLGLAPLTFRFCTEAGEPVREDGNPNELTEMYVVEERGFTPYNHSAQFQRTVRRCRTKNEDSLRWGMTPNQRISELRGAGCRQLHRAPVEGEECFLTSPFIEQAIALRTGSMSVNAMFHQLLAFDDVQQFRCGNSVKSS